MIGKVLIWSLVGSIYLFSYSLMRCASLADRDYERLAHKKFYGENKTKSTAESTDDNEVMDGCLE
ncbi:MAG: hypothetical protein EOM34_08665 [Clostridia bacterium]|nr:hypothetical protein [Lachnospiraceae bacterium]NCC00738.1 hypothetical protein [Clostridia bacterium]NCD03102.1 hypothetical protein [Clostridia bacterium]